MNKMALAEAESPKKVKKLTKALSGGISEWQKEPTERSIANIGIAPDN